MAHLFIAHQTGIWVHCDKRHKTSSVSMNKYPDYVLVHLHVAAGQDQWDRAQYLKESYNIQQVSLPPRVYLVHTWVCHERSYRHKSFEPLCLRKKKEKKNRFYMLFWKRQNYGDNKKISARSLRGVKGRRIHRYRSFYEQ